jgi:hypothetical protein
MAIIKMVESQAAMVVIESKAIKLGDAIRILRTCRKIFLVTKNAPPEPNWRHVARE